VAKGSRLIYLEEFLVDEAEADEFIRSVRDVVRHWLDNIKRYAELRGDWIRRWGRWLFDLLSLKAQPEQQRIIIALLAMQAVMFLIFVAAALGLGIASLFR